MSYRWYSGCLILSPLLYKTPPWRITGLGDIAIVLVLIVASCNVYIQHSSNPPHHIDSFTPEWQQGAGFIYPSCIPNPNLAKKLQQFLLCLSLIMRKFAVYTTVNIFIVIWKIRFLISDVISYEKEGLLMFIICQHLVKQSLRKLKAGIDLSAHFTDMTEVAIEISWKFCYSNSYLNDPIRSQFLYLPQKLSCGMCKIVTWSDDHIPCMSIIQNNVYNFFHKIWIISQKTLVKRIPHYRLALQICNTLAVSYLNSLAPSSPFY